MSRMYALLYSDGNYGALVELGAAVKAYRELPPERRGLVAITAWQRVDEATAETIPPPPDPFSHAEVDKSVRETLPTLREVK